MEVYLDNISSTPVLDEIKKEIPLWLDLYFANSSSMHDKGLEVKRVITKARKNISKYLGIKNTQELIFTSGDIESNNLAIKGFALSKGISEKGKHILISPIEHISVLHSVRTLERLGFEVEYLPVDNYGLIDVDSLKEKVRKDTILVSVGLANREIGTIQDIKQFVKIVKEKNPNTVFHTDISPAVSLLKIDLDDLGVDMATFSGHYFYALKYSGGLYVKKDVRLKPIIEGGVQEGGKRAGMENVIGILSMEKALKILYESFDKNINRLKFLTDKLKKGIIENFDDVVLTGHPDNRLPNHLSFCLKSIKSEPVITFLNLKKIYISSSSPCISNAQKESYVLKAIGAENPESALVFSVGLSTTEDMIDYTLCKFKESYEVLKTYL